MSKVSITVGAFVLYNRYPEEKNASGAREIFSARGLIPPEINCE